MALKAKRVAQSARNNLKSPVLDADNYPARLVQVIDLGLQQNYFEKEKSNYQIMLTYELVTEFCLDEKDEPVTDKPRWLSETINLIDLPVGMSPLEIYTDQYKGKSKFVQRCKALDPKGKKDFDIADMAEEACAVTVVQRKKGSGEMTNDVGGVTAPMKGLQVAELVNPAKVFDLEEPDLEIFKSLPDWLQEKIKGNLEYNGSPLQEALSGTILKEEKKPVKKEEPKKEQPEEEEEVDNVDW